MPCSTHPPTDDGKEGKGKPKYYDVGIGMERKIWCQPVDVLRQNEIQRNLAPSDVVSSINEKGATMT